MPESLQTSINNMNMKTHKHQSNAAKRSLGTWSSAPYRIAYNYPLAALLVGLYLASPTAAATFPLPGDALACGKTLAQWQAIDFLWGMGVLPLPSDSHGNAVSNNMVILKCPPLNDGTISNTLINNQPFVLHVLDYYGDSYTNGPPADPSCDLGFLQSLSLILTMDGSTVMDSSSATSYFFQNQFPPTPDPTTPGAFLIWNHEIAAVFPPLSTGHHIIELRVQWSIPCWGPGTGESHRIWYLTVLTNSAVQTNAPPLSAAIKNGQFGFNLRGPAGRLVVVETSTNLLDWQPIWLDAFHGDLIFRDPRSSALTRGFYRTRMP
jgi:hypothetical protein